MLPATKFIKAYRHGQEVQTVFHTKCQNGGQKHVILERGQRRRARLVKADRKVTVTQIATHYSSSMQKSISEHAKHQDL